MVSLSHSLLVALLLIGVIFADEVDIGAQLHFALIIIIFTHPPPRKVVSARVLDAESVSFVRRHQEHKNSENE